MAYIGNQPALGNFVKLDAIVTSATATYNLLNGGVAFTPASANQCIVSLNGVIQEPTSASNVGGFTISGSTIVFTSALTSLDVIDFILVLGDVLNIGTPSDSTVSFAKVTSNLITGATAETSIAGGDSILLFDDSASALRKMTRTNFVAGIGGTNTPIFVAKSSVDQSVPATTWTKVNFGTEDIDTGSLFASSRFTVDFTGKVFLNAKLLLDFHGDQKFIIINIYKNGGASTFGSQSISNSGTYEIGIQTSIIDSCVSTDYYEVYFYHNDTVARNLRSVYCVFSGFKLIE